MQILSITFPFSLHPGQIPAFRAAIAEAVGFDQELFHQHNNSNPAQGALKRDYPKIQYSVRRGKAAITGLGEGAEAIREHLLLEQPEWIEIGGQAYATAGLQVQESSLELRINKAPDIYGLASWMALNSENYQEWKLQQADETERLRILSRALTGQLRAMGETLGLADYKKLDGKVLKVDRQKKVYWHQTELIVFDAVVQLNVDLPSGIGLGRAAAFGYGEVKSFLEYAKYRQTRMLVNALV